MQIYSIDLQTSEEEEKYSINKFEEIFKKEKTRPYAIVLNPITLEKLTYSIVKHTCVGMTTSFDTIMGFLLESSDKIDEDVVKVAYNESELRELKHLGATIDEIQQKSGLGPFAISAMRLAAEKTPYMLELLKRGLSGERIVFNPDIARQIAREELQRKMSESIQRANDDSIDALAYSRHAYTILVGVPVRRPDPTQKVYICEGLDKIYITGQNLERKLKATKGKARRKIRRQLRQRRRK